MSALVENTSTLGRRLKMSVPGETVQAQIKTKMAKLAREIKLKGFRPGKVPEKILQQRFGESVRSEVINDLIRESFSNVIKEKELHLAGSPKIEEVQDTSGENLEFTAIFEVFPEIALASISDVEIEKRSVDIQDQDVQDMIEKLQDQLADWEEVERPVQKDDKLTVDFARLFKEDEAKREEQNDVQMIVGDKGVIPGLSDALVGKHKGEQIEKEFTYPEDWSDKSVAGKTATLWVTIHQIAQKQKLSLQALMAKFQLEENAADQLAVKVRERMQAEVEDVLQEELKEKVLEKLLEKNPLEIPQALVEQERTAIYRELARKAKQGTLTQEETLDIDEQARKRVELGLLLNEVIKKYQIKPNIQAVKAQIEKIASRFNESAEIAKAYLANNELRQNIERMVLLDQAVASLSNEIKMKEKRVSFKEVMNPEDMSEKN